MLMEEPQVGTRERLLELSAQLFRERGFHATSMRDIARAAHMQPASIYHHFPGKESILHELMRGFLMELLHSAANASDQAADAIGRLAAFMRTHIRLHATRAMVALVTDSELRALKDPARREVVMLRDRYEQLLQDILRQGVQEGLMHVPDVKIASYQLLALGTGVVFWWRPDGRLSLEEIVEQHVGAAFGICGVGRGKRG